MTTEQQAIELAIEELDNEELSMALTKLLAFTPAGWQKDALRNWKMLTIKQKELIKILKRKSSMLGDVKTECSPFYPMSTSAKPKR